MPFPSTAQTLAICQLSETNCEVTNFSVLLLFQIFAEFFPFINNKNHRLVSLYSLEFLKKCGKQSCLHLHDAPHRISRVQDVVKGLIDANKAPLVMGKTSLQFTNSSDRGQPVWRRIFTGTAFVPFYKTKCNTSKKKVGKTCDGVGWGGGVLFLGLSLSRSLRCTAITRKAPKLVSRLCSACVLRESSVHLAYK